METDATKPAFHIPLTDDNLRMLGEIAAIQGQIEWLMQWHVAVLIPVAPYLAKTILGSGGMAANANVWIEIARDRLQDRAPDTCKLAEQAYSEIGALSAQRNDFMHAFFAEDVGGGILFGPNPADEIQGRFVAIRTRTGKMTAITEIKAVRDRAARLSVLMNEIFGRLTRKDAKQHLA